MKKHAFWTTALSILLALAVGGLAGWLSRDGMTAFEALKKPPLTPPGQVFPIVWGVLFTLMGVSAAIIARSGSVRREGALFAYAAQLFVNFWWPIFFFRLEARLISLVWLLLLLALVVVMLLRFWRIRPVAGILNLPYLLWLLFAAYLNLGVFLLNR